MKSRLIEIAAICVLGSLALTATSRAAAAKVTDPRKCVTYSTPAKCAYNAAKLVARRVLGRKVGETMWQPPLTCTSAGTLLRWRCWFQTGRTDVLPAKGYLAVTYKATHTGWHVYTTVVATP